jgi:hydroxymethylpyrimidine kinase/phosphomethylpyrimidine kinase
MVATTGAHLLPADAVDELRTSLLPKTTILTPNLPEAQCLLGKRWQKDPNTVDDLVAMAQSLRLLGPRYVLVKGGHIPFREDGTKAELEDEKYHIVNVLAGPHETVVQIRTAYLESKNTHGTGCSLACTSQKRYSRYYLTYAVGSHC